MRPLQTLICLILPATSYHHLKTSRCGMWQFLMSCSLGKVNVACGIDTAEWGTRYVECGEFTYVINVCTRYFMEWNNISHEEQIYIFMQTNAIYC